MNHSIALQLTLFLGVLFAIAWPLSAYMYALLEGNLSRRFSWVGTSERWLGKFVGFDAEKQMHWTTYTKSELPRFYRR